MTLNSLAQSGIGNWKVPKRFLISDWGPTHSSINHIQKQQALKDWIPYKLKRFKFSRKNFPKILQKNFRRNRKIFLTFQQFGLRPNPFDLLTRGDGADSIVYKSYSKFRCIPEPRARGGSIPHPMYIWPKNCCLKM